ncbi:unnamed protein product [Dovyalis caffra]|uniref:Uncharacterized protein n=1 Tax=Dovyalis caffra TaxID=77055 RepID=A0AAV1S617_9ROSI|nr:unnamed protein product [Dovyalis caffra]
MPISSLSASIIPSLNTPNSTSNYSSKLSTFSSLKFPAQLRRLKFRNRGVSFHSRSRNLPLVAAKKQTFSTFDELLEISDKPVLVDFYATWCGPCQFMAPILNEVSDVLKDTVQVVKIDTEKYPSIADKYKIEALPTFIIFKDGKPYDRFEGALNKDQLIQRVENSLNFKDQYNVKPLYSDSLRLNHPALPKEYHGTIMQAACHNMDDVFPKFLIGTRVRHKIDNPYYKDCTGKQEKPDPCASSESEILSHNGEEDSRIQMEMEMEMKMRAGEDVEIGEDITPPLIPLSFALHDPFLHSHCSSCFSLLPNTSIPHHHHVPTLLYCSSLCSSSHFSPAELNLLHYVPSSDLRAALRLLHHLLPSSSDRICGLLTNREKLMTDEEISARVRDGARAIAAVRRMEMDKDTNENEKDAVLLEAALCLVLTNAVEVQDDEGRSLGIAVYGPNFSWINHSCSPNACYRFIISPPDNALPLSDESRLRILPTGTKGENVVHNKIEFPKGCSGSGPRVIARSIRRIKKGEEVTVAYTDLLQPKEIRQSELWAKYRFICCCTRCSASPLSYVDHILQDSPLKLAFVNGRATSKANGGGCKEICASNLASLSLSSELSFYKDEATRKLTDYVDEVIAEYLAVGDPESCCKKLENMLNTGLRDDELEAREGKSQLNFRLHSLHHLALNTYTTLASAYKIRANDLYALHSEVGGHSLEVLSMSRISAAYSLLLAAATYHLFCFESSLIASVANFWANAGESLLALARSSAWDSLGECGLPVLNLSSLAKHNCSKCSCNLYLGQDETQKADFDSISSRFLDCISSLLQKVWGFLIQGCCYLKMFKVPTDFSWLGKSLDMWDFDAHLTHNDLDFNCWTNESISGVEALGYTDQCRINIFQLGAHCLLYGGFLAGICHGPHSHWISHIRCTLDYEGK